METYFAVNYSGTEVCSNYELFRRDGYWSTISPDDKYDAYDSSGDPDDVIVELPKGTIKRILGYELNWFDDCVTL